MYQNHNEACHSESVITWSFFSVHLNIGTQAAWAFCPHQNPAAVTSNSVAQCDSKNQRVKGK